MLPEGWTAALLGNVFQFKNGLNGDKSLYGTGTKFVNVMDVFRGPRLCQHEIAGEMAVSPQQLTEFAVIYGDVLFNRTSETDDEIALSTVYLGTEPAVFGGFVIRARPDSSAIIPEFSVYRFRAPDIRQEMIRRGQGAIRSNIGQGDLSTVPITLPPLTEQRKIAEILSTWDRAIAAVEKLIANARTQKTALMQQLLTGMTRLPGFDGDWHWIKFSNVFERVRQKNNVGNTNVLTISAQHGLISQVEYFNKSVASDDVRGYTLLARRDFAYNKSYSNGYPMGAFKPLERYDSGIVSSLYICFRLANPSCNHDFFRHYFEAGLFNREISSIAQEGARNHGLLNVSVVEFFDTSLHVPADEEQIAIAERINTAENHSLDLEAQLAALRQEKFALMQQLLTGKRRVTIDQPAALKEAAA